MFEAYCSLRPQLDARIRKPWRAASLTPSSRGASAGTRTTCTTTRMCLRVDERTQRVSRVLILQSLFDFRGAGVYCAMCSVPAVYSILGLCAAGPLDTCGICARCLHLGRLLGRPRRRPVTTKGELYKKGNRSPLNGHRKISSMQGSGGSCMARTPDDL